jgi:hypothetical protein
MRPSTLIELISLALSLTFSAAVLGQDWSKYYSERDQFIVNFPGDPDVAEVDYVSESNVLIPARIYSVDDGESRYAIKVVDYTLAEQAHVDHCRQMAAESQRISPNQCIGRGHLRDIDGAIAYEAWNIRRRGGEITYDAFGRIDGVPGHQLQILHADGSRSFIGLYLYERRLYVLEGTVPGDAPPPGLFQQSLGILDEMGRRVRYQPDSDGNYARVQTLYEYVGEEDPITGEPISDLFGGDDGRMRAPGERMGQWTPEDSRGDLRLVASLVSDPELFALIEQANVSSADVVRFRTLLETFLRLGEFAWQQTQAGVLDEANLTAYMEAASDLLVLERTRTEWRNGLYTGDAGFMAFMDGWISDRATGP